MNVISRPALEAAKRKHPDAVGWIDGWWGIAKRMQWESLDDVRRAYPATDQVGRCLVFNVRGNRYRLIVGIQYATPSRGGTLFIKHFLTHAEYDQNQWKKDCSCR